MPPDQDIETRLFRYWLAVSPRMATLPVYNPALQVQVTTFRRSGNWRAGVVVTPWFMNVIAVHDGPAVLPLPGLPVIIALPAGEIDATVGELPGYGRFAAASLFSPMDRFDDPEVTLSVANTALETLFAPEAPQSRTGIDRRSLLRGSLSRSH